MEITTTRHEAIRDSDDTARLVHTVGGKAIRVYRARHHGGGCYQSADEYNSGVECACVSSTSQLSVGYEAEGWRAFGM